MITLKITQARRNLLARRVDKIAAKAGQTAYRFRNQFGYYCLIGAMLTDSEINYWRQSGDGSYNWVLDTLFGTHDFDPAVLYMIHDNANVVLHGQRANVAALDAAINSLIETGEIVLSEVVGSEEEGDDEDF